MTEQNDINVPSRVKLAVNLLYASLAVGIIKSALYETLSNDRMLGDSWAISVFLITFLILGFLGYMMGLGKNWARITFLVLFALGMLVYPGIVMYEFGLLPIIGIVSIVQMLMQGYVILLTYTGESKEWFVGNRM